MKVSLKALNSHHKYFDIKIKTMVNILCGSNVAF